MLSASIKSNVFALLSSDSGADGNGTEEGTKQRRKALPVTQEEFLVAWVAESKKKTPGTRADVARRIGKLADVKKTIKEELGADVVFDGKEVTDWLISKVRSMESAIKQSLPKNHKGLPKLSEMKKGKTGSNLTGKDLGSLLDGLL